MSFSFPRLVILTVSVLSISALAGCSSMGGLSSQSKSNPNPVTNNNVADPYDAYYGSPATRAYEAPRYSPKI